MDSFLARFYSQVTDCLQDPSTSKRYPNAQRYNDLRTAQARLFNKLLNGAGAESELGYTEKTITFVADQEYYPLPPLFRQFVKLERRDNNDPRILLQYLPSLDTYGDGPGVLILRDQNLLQMRPKTPDNWVADWTLCYRRGPAVLHDGSIADNKITADTLECDATPDNGTLIKIADYYAGCLVRVYGATTGAPQTNLCTGNTVVTGTVTLEFARKDWDPLPQGSVKYEICPDLPDELDDLYAMDVALLACAKRPALRRRAGLLLDRDDLWKTVRGYYANTVADREPRRSAPPRPYAQDPYD